jgi:pyruvate/2-oxoglutarate dehydrogenase complex dihydrolipoamide acyltransferase (E2) component
LGLSFGLVKERPVVRDGAIVARRTTILTFNFDRRLLAGAPGARFCKRLVDILENPAVELASYLPTESCTEDESVAVAGGR